MKMVFFCGKGGVGKTISATSFALALARKGERTLLIDCDGGHSVTNTLGIGGDIAVPANAIHRIESNLSIVIVENPEYKNVLQVKREGLELNQYFEQFPGHFGLIALADALLEFFGVPIDISALHKFTVLVTVLSTLESEEFKNIILDVEPTAGLERLLSHTDSMVRTLHNLKKRGTQFFASIVLRWSDVADYISGEYFESIDTYSRDIVSVARMMRRAVFILVCTPEFGPVTQMFDIQKIIQKFGGKVRGYVINNVRYEEHEKQNVDLLKALRVPHTIIPRRNDIHTQQDPSPILLEIGENLYLSFRSLLSTKSQRV